MPDVWALGVGAVITGAYFGWNLGLKDNGPVALLVASLLVCLLYLAWVLALAFLPNGRHALSGSADDTLRWWDWKAGKEQRRLRWPKMLLEGPNRGIALDPERQRLAFVIVW